MQEKLIYILIISILLSSCDFTTADEYYNQSIDYQEKGDYEKEQEFLEKVLEKDPEFRPALLNHGANNSDFGDYKGAIKDYQKIIDFDSDNTIALFAIGNNYKRLENYEKAISYYNLALKTDGAYKSDSIFSKWVFVGNNEFDKDNEYHIRKCEIEYERGLAYLENEQYELAISDFKKIIKVNYENPISYYWIGEAYIGLKDSTGICDNFIKSAKLGFEEAKDKLREHCIKKQQN